ncbi:MAG: carboxymuconolactone decarboxylase family protein, partial [Pseudolabrys sp.]
MAKSKSKTTTRTHANTRTSAKPSAKIRSKPGSKFTAQIADKFAAAKKAAAKPVTLTTIRGGKAVPPKPAAGKPVPAATPPDDMPVIALNLPATKLSPAMSAYFKKCQDKLGFVPNVLLAYAFDMAKLETFVAMYDELMFGASGLSKLEREMIAVAVSSQNRCYYC